MDDELFTRDEVQSGSISRVRRARALVYLIEQEASRGRDRRNRTAASAPVEFAVIPSVAMMQSIIDSDPEVMRGKLPGEQDDAFISSFRNARRVTSPAQFKALATNLDDWRVLLPDNLPLRAELLHQLSLRHTLVLPRAKRIAEAFGVGTAEFDAAYLAATGESVSTAFTEKQGLFSRLRRKA